MCTCAAAGGNEPALLRQSVRLSGLQPAGVQAHHHGGHPPPFLGQTDNSRSYSGPGRDSKFDLDAEGSFLVYLTHLCHFSGVRDNNDPIILIMQYTVPRLTPGPTWSSLSRILIISSCQGLSVTVSLSLKLFPLS